MDKKNLLIYGWRGINHSIALVNQNQLIHLQNLDDVNVFHMDAPFVNKNWNATQNFSGFDHNKQSIINKPVRPDKDLKLDCIYTATYPFDLFHQNKEFFAPRILNFLVTEFGIYSNDLIDKNLNPRSFLREADRIIVPSMWSKNKVIEHGFLDEFVEIIPHGFDPEIFYPPTLVEKEELKGQIGATKNDYIFLNTGAMTWNKGIDILVEAFLILRKKYTHIKLVLKDQSNLYGIQAQGIIHQLLTAKPHLNDNNILDSFIIINNNLSLSQLRHLYCAADCYVSPYRAEGFNLTVLEALACGTDVIVTDGGATDDFCKNDSIGKIHSLKTSNVELNKSRNYTNNQGHFLEPNVASLVELMERRINGCSRVHQHLADMALENFTWQHAVQKLHKLI